MTAVLQCQNQSTVPADGTTAVSLALTKQVNDHTSHTTHPKLHHDKTMTVPEPGLLAVVAQ